MRVHDEAEDAAYRIRAYNATRAGEQRRSRARRIERAIAALVVVHGGNTVVAPYDGPVPAAARRTATLAASRGFRVIERKTLAGHAVEGIHDERGVGFHAYWTRGKTSGGSWHVRGRDIWRVVDITSRPIGVDSRSMTTKINHRHDAGDRTRLELVSSARGVAQSITDLERWIRE